VDGIVEYLAFMLIVVTVGLSIICLAVFSIALYEIAGWAWSLLRSREAIPHVAAFEPSYASSSLPRPMQAQQPRTSEVR
jgi:hypothetical protein